MKENENAVATRPNEGVVGFVQTDVKVIQIFQQKCNATLMNIFNDESLVRRFISSVMLAVARNPKLKECTQESFMHACLSCAEVKLFPSEITGQCFLIPYKNNKKNCYEVKFMLGYQGMITLAERAGCKMVDAQVVYEKDEVHVTLGTDPSIIHIADVFNADRGAARGVYAVAILKSGHKRVVPLPLEKVHKDFRDKSQSWLADKKYKSTNSPWQEGNDPLLTMPRKTAIRQIFKFIPKDDLAIDPTVSRALDLDSQGEYGRREIEINPVDELIEDDVKLTNSDITRFRKRLVEVEGYTDTEIKNATIDALERDKFGDLLQSEAAAVERQLKENREKKASEQESTLTGTDQDGFNYDE